MISNVRALLLCSIPFALLGCAGANSGRLYLHPLNTHKEYSQRFTQSYAAHDVDGSYEFLLIADDADRRRPKVPGQPLRPSTGTPLREVIYVRIPWMPMRGNVSQTLVANAVVDWYIFSDAPEHQNDVVKYSGVGYALADQKDGIIQLELRSATLQPQIVRGDFHDPLGKFRLSGDVSAANFPQRLHAILDATRARLKP